VTHRLLAAALVALVSCGGGTPGDRPGPVEDAEALELQIAFQGLCDARTLAEVGDMWGAANEFQSHAHAYLHEFADRLSAVDRTAAGRLLEAKEAVEAQLNAPDSADPALTVSALSQLEVALADGAEREGLPRPACGGAVA
jgi:hypothetical protein